MVSIDDIASAGSVSDGLRFRQRTTVIAHATMDSVKGEVAAVTVQRDRTIAFAREREVLKDLLQGARTQRGGCLVMRGEVGSGKTSLLEYATSLALDFHVAKVEAVESECDLAYAGLQRLCSTMLDRLDRLPDVQRNALEAAFGMRAGAIDRAHLGLAVLGLLAEHSTSIPVVCVVDDAQWLDRSSSQTLAFVARRLRAERVALLFAARGPVEEFRGLPELIVDVRSHAEAHALLASVFPGPLHGRVAERMVAESRGDLHALLALSHDVKPDQLAGGFGLPPVLSRTNPLVGVLRNRLLDLPTDISRLLLLAAADPEGDCGLFWRAAPGLGLGPAIAEEAVSRNVLQFAGRITFRHPAMRSIVYHDARFDERCRVHRALADATDRERDPDRQAWHRSLATVAADEDVAEALERSAGRAQMRGGLAAAAAFLERSCALTADPDRRAKRALSAACAKYESGSTDSASELLSACSPASLDDVEHVLLMRLRARVAQAHGGTNISASWLLDAAMAFEPLDAELARDTYLEALDGALCAGHAGSDLRLEEAVTAARAAPTRIASSASDLLFNGLVLLFTDGYGMAAPILQRAVRAFTLERDTQWLGLAGRAAAELWDVDAALDLVSRWEDHARNVGALAKLAAALDQLAALQAHLGDFDAASRYVDEAAAVGRATGGATGAYGRMALAAWRGSEERMAELTENVRGVSVERGEGSWLLHTKYCTAVLCNGLGRYADALTAVEDDYGHERLSACYLLPELVEAAARDGKRTLATTAAEVLADRTRLSRTEWGLGFQARSLALVNEGDAAEKLYREAITRFGRTRGSVHLARAHLLYGEWLRRERRRVDAREQLRTAHVRFSALGAAAFAARARRELLATGEHARKRTVDTATDLTPREAEIAVLARDGHSNPQIAAKLFISARTVEYHLHKVFTKLDIGSRAELAYTLDR